MAEVMDRNERRARMKRRKQKQKRAILIGLAILCCIALIVWACIAIFSEKPLPVVYAKNGMLLVKTDNEDKPLIISQDYKYGATALVEDGKGLLFINGDNTLSYCSLKSAASASKLTQIAKNVSSFAAPSDKLIYYVKGDTLYVNDRKTEKSLMSGINTPDLKTTEDGKYIFFNTATDLYGIQAKKEAMPVHIAKNADVYSLLYIQEEDNPILDGSCLYVVANRKFIQMDKELNTKVLCENVTTGFVLNKTPFAVTETQIGETEFRYNLVDCKDKPTQLASNLVHGHEIPSGVYKNQKYLLFVGFSEKTKGGESYYTLDEKSNFRYLCESKNYKNLELDPQGKYAYIHTDNDALYEYKLSGKAELDTASKKEIAKNISDAYLVGDHISITFSNRYGIYHGGKYEDIYKDIQSQPKIRVYNNKAYICDQTASAPFLMCKNGKLSEVDDGVCDFKLVSKNRIAYLKPNDDAATFDLYLLDVGKEPVKVDTGITMLY